MGVIIFSRFLDDCRMSPSTPHDISNGDDVHSKNDSNGANESSSLPPQSSSTPTGPKSQSTTHEPRKRPKLDLSALMGAGPGAERKRKAGKSMFGVIVGTLTKAKIEDKERSATEAVSSCYITIVSDSCFLDRVIGEKTEFNRTASSSQDCSRN